MANFIPRIMLTFAILASLSAASQAPKMLGHVNARLSHVFTHAG